MPGRSPPVLWPARSVMDWRSESLRNFASLEFNGRPMDYYQTYVQRDVRSIINVGDIGADDNQDAVDTIVNTAGHKKYQPNTYSINCMKNIALSCRIEAALIDQYPGIEVVCDKGNVCVYSKTFKRKHRKLALALKEEIMKINGVEHIEVFIEKQMFNECAIGNSHRSEP